LIELSSRQKQTELEQTASTKLHLCSCLHHYTTLEVWKIKYFTPRTEVSNQTNKPRFVHLSGEKIWDDTEYVNANL